MSSKPLACDSRGYESNFVGILTGGRRRPHWLDLIDLHVFQLNITRSKPPNTTLPTQRFLPFGHADRIRKTTPLDPRPMCRFRSAHRSLHSVKQFKDPGRRDLHLPLSSRVRYPAAVAIVGSEVKKNILRVVRRPVTSSRVIRLLTNPVSSGLPQTCSYCHCPFLSHRPIHNLRVLLACRFSPTAKSHPRK